MVEHLLAGRPAGAVPDLGQRCFAVEQFGQKNPGINGGEMLGLHRAATTGLRFFEFPAVVPAAVVTLAHKTKSGRKRVAIRRIVDKMDIRSLFRLSSGYTTARG